MIKRIELLDGKEYPVLFSFRAIRKMKELLGKTEEEIFEQLESVKDSDNDQLFRLFEKVLYSCIYAGFKAEKEECPIELNQMEDLMSPHDLGKYVDIVYPEIESTEIEEEEKKLRAVV